MKARNKLQRQYVDVRKQEGNYEQLLYSLKCNQQCTPDAFRDGKKSSKVWLIQLKILKRGGRCCWSFCKQAKRKKVALTFFDVKKQKQRYASDVFKGSAGLRKMSVIN